MSTLILVRHGQASFGSSNYDQLSEMGISQSSALGEYWVKRARKLDAVFSGAQERQKHTLALVQDAYARAGLAFPRPQVLAAFNEYDAIGIMSTVYPRLLQEDPRLQKIVEENPNFGDASPEGKRAFQRAFEIVIDCWLEGEVDMHEIESWKQFQQRVVQGVDKLKAEFQSGKTVAIFTSGGAISTAVGHDLGMSDRKAMSLQWVVKNSSLTEFMFGGQRSTMTGFNLTPHFTDDSFITYR
jgi:broad specificity phosphatase PhoE